jgi:predicted lactoylglutathione lyase
MSTQIFINLPVKDLDKSVAFFTALGYTFNPQFTDKNATCMIVSDEHSYVMLLVEPFFKTFTHKPIADANKTTEVLICLSCDSRSTVDAMVKKALTAGGSTPNPPQDHGFMYQHGFQDLDGHLWELVYMDPSFAPHAQADKASANAGT